MPQRTKSRQKSDQLELVDDFVQSWVKNNNLPNPPGRSLAERRCSELANSARNQFKVRRNEENNNAMMAAAAAAALAADTVSTASPVTSPSLDTRVGHLQGGATSSMGGIIDDDDDHDDEHHNLDHFSPEVSDAAGVVSANSHDSNDRTGHKHRNLSAAQKYNIRLNNNRRSAHATKVFNEIYRRELSRCILDYERRLQSKRYAANVTDGGEGSGGDDETLPNVNSPTPREVELEAELTVTRRHVSELMNNLTVCKIERDQLSTRLKRFCAHLSVHPQFQPATSTIPSTSTPMTSMPSPSSRPATTDAFKQPPIHLKTETALPSSSSQMSPPTKSDTLQIPVHPNPRPPSASQSQQFMTQDMSEFMDANQDDDGSGKLASVMGNVPVSSPNIMPSFLGSQHSQPDGDDIGFEPNDYFNSQGVSQTHNTSRTS